MTPTRYFIARIAQAFGYYQKSQRMGDAANEAHLLREAETQLGIATWRNVEHVQALSVEYWNLRKLIKERAEIDERLAACQARLDQAHADRVNILTIVPDGNQELLDERIKLLAELEALSVRRDQVIAEAHEVRRNYTGLKTKLEVLTDEARHSVADQAEIDKVKSDLRDVKIQFAKLKEVRVEISMASEASDLKIDQVEAKLKQNQSERRARAYEAFQVIGDGNKEISRLRTESGVIDAQMRQLHAEIGRYISRNIKTDPECATVAASSQGLVDVMHALRRSITLNQHLAGIS